MLEHGGNLNQAVTEFGIPRADWLDLSTGINPVSWPVPRVPADIWQRLPETNDGLIDVAAAYYGHTSVLPVSGSQAAIQTLPTLRAKSRVAVVSPGYAEHAAAWVKAGHDVDLLKLAQLSAEYLNYDVVVIIQPNNPTGEMLSPVLLKSMAEQLSYKQGWLVLDEAFVDCYPNQSVLSEALSPALIVLRSLGKFFGLAGLRLGFVFAEPKILSELEDVLGPWSVSAPARWVGINALQDKLWQVKTREMLLVSGERLVNLLSQKGFTVSGHTALYSWMMLDNADLLQQNLAKQGIWVRYFDQPKSVRFGLPGSEEEWQRLSLGLDQANKSMFA